MRDLVGLSPADGFSATNERAWRLAAWMIARHAADNGMCSEIGED